MLTKMNVMVVVIIFAVFIKSCMCGCLYVYVHLWGNLHVGTDVFAGILISVCIINKCFNNYVILWSFK